MGCDILRLSSSVADMIKRIIFIFHLSPTVSCVRASEEKGRERVGETICYNMRISAYIFSTELCVGSAAQIGAKHFEVCPSACLGLLPQSLKSFLVFWQSLKWKWGTGTCADLMSAGGIGYMPAARPTD